MKRTYTQRKDLAESAGPPEPLPVYPDGHPRNPYTHAAPDFAALAEEDPRLAPYLIPIPGKDGGERGRVTVDFGKAEATVAVTQALLRCDWGLEVSVPDGTLCPTVSSRLNYLLEVQDLVRWAGHDPASPTHVLDIGTGYTAIYPLLGARLDPSWRFTGTDIDAAALALAAANIERNGLGDRIALLPAREATGPFFPADVPFTVTMCNPPYYASAADRAARAAAKATGHAATPGTDAQMVTEGGEVQFVRRMMRESKEHASGGDGRVKTLYTSLVGVKSTVEALRVVAAEIETTTFQVRTLRQGTTARWVVAWSFDPSLASPPRAKLLYSDAAVDVAELLRRAGVRYTVVPCTSDPHARAAAPLTTVDAFLVAPTWTRRYRRGNGTPVSVNDDAESAPTGARVRLWWTPPAAPAEGGRQRDVAVWISARWDEMHVHSFYTWLKRSTTPTPPPIMPLPNTRAPCAPTSPSQAVIRYSPPASPSLKMPVVQGPALPAHLHKPLTPKPTSATSPTATLPLDGPSPLAGQHVHVIYDVGYADPALHADLLVPLVKVAGHAGDAGISTWVLRDAAHARELARRVPKDGVVLLHADVPSSVKPGQRFEALRAFLAEGQFPRVVGHTPEYCEATAHKSTMHALFTSAQVPHAESLCITSPEQLHSAATRAFITSILATPGAELFLKVDAGCNSEGLTESCIVSSYDAAVTSTAALLATFGPVVVQRYLSGREFTIAVCTTPGGVRAFHPVERLFAPGQRFSPPDGTPAERIVSLAEEPALVATCRSVAAKAYEAVGGCAWGRVDVRCDTRGNVMVLEVNNTAAFGPNSYFAMSCRAMGLEREHVIDLVARTGWRPTEQYTKE
ncbi:hypothetical protein H9P43_008677 [Blastocladiella emersonii ATCC 22665]|nr:hypothetical protein H9P43_008677 [Blastocladiella emersonii ATCC 22665]